MRVDISHEVCVNQANFYLDTLKKKPGALRNSAALKSVPKLRAIFETHYAKQPKKFIEIFLENRELPIDEILKLFEEKASHKAEISALDIVMPVAPR
jgi:hypothetical protein